MADVGVSQDELAFRYALTHVRMNVAIPLQSMTMEEVMDVYAMLPPPIKSFREWLDAKGLSSDKLDELENEQNLRVIMENTKSNG